MRCITLSGCSLKTFSLRTVRFNLLQASSIALSTQWYGGSLNTSWPCLLMRLSTKYSFSTSNNFILSKSTGLVWTGLGIGIFFLTSAHACAEVKALRRFVQFLDLVISAVSRLGDFCSFSTW